MTLPMPPLIAVADPPEGAADCARCGGYRVVVGELRAEGSRALGPHGWAWTPVMVPCPSCLEPR